MPLFPDHHLPSATLLLVLTSLLSLLSLLLCLPLPAVPAHTYFPGARSVGKGGRTCCAHFPGLQLSQCLVMRTPAYPQASRKSPVQEHVLFHKPWAHGAHVKPTQVQGGLESFSNMLSHCYLHTHLHIWSGKSQATRSALLRVTSLLL